MIVVGTEKEICIFRKDQDEQSALAVQTRAGGKIPPLGSQVMGNTGASFENMRKCSA